MYTCTCRYMRQMREYASTQTLVIHQWVGPSSFFLGKVTALGVLCCFAVYVQLAWQLCGIRFHSNRVGESYQIWQWIDGTVNVRNGQRISGTAFILY